MTLRHLEIFCQVCRKESITLAAEKLNMTQPAVSIAIGELESFYGVKLFERMNRRIYITEAGRVLLQYADTVLSQYEESIEVLRRQKAFDSCRISVNITYAEAALTQKMKQLREKIPSLLWKLFVCNNEQIERKLRENEVDFAVAVLTFTTRLPLVKAFGVKSLLEGFAVGNLGSAHVCLYLELAQKSVYYNIKVEFAHACDYRLAGLLVGISLEGGVFLCKLDERHGHLFLAGLGLGLY